MRSRYGIRDGPAAYFVTSTIVEWLPVLSTTACCEIIVRALLHAREHNSLRIYAWVILDNHFHAILSAPDLSGTLRSLKGFTAQELLKQLKAERREWLLQLLAHHRADHKRASEHQVWQEGVHPQVIDSDKMLHQKLDYLHDNPVKRGLVAAPEHWRYSSAHEWLVGASPLLICDPLQ